MQQLSFIFMPMGHKYLSRILLDRIFQQKEKILLLPGIYSNPEYYLAHILF